jgi:maleate isomerase
MNPKSSVAKMKFVTDGGLGTKARLGLIVLQTDQTIEHEFANLFVQQDAVALYATRIPNDTEVTPETLRKMSIDLPHAAGLLAPKLKFDVIAYACTSGATMIGEARVDELIRDFHPVAKTTNPLSASKAALVALGIRRIALVTPYAIDVTLQLQASLSNAGFEINAVATFDQIDDFTVARISADSILNAVLEIGKRDDCDGVFVSCTSLRTMQIIGDAETRLGKPVISSNQALAWHMMRLACLSYRPLNAGCLFTANCS